MYVIKDQDGRYFAGDSDIKFIATATRFIWATLAVHAHRFRTLEEAVRVASYIDSPSVRVVPFEAALRDDLRCGGPAGSNFFAFEAYSELLRELPGCHRKHLEL